MVVFICSVCGQSLKKNQVDKHCAFECRQCAMVSCVDCGKEFWGNDYADHTKCISEEEKYSGKLYKGKSAGKKGEVKQEAWTVQVQRAVEGMEGDVAVRGLLLQIQDCSNIPRKQAKFQNFLRNSLRIRNDNLITRAWQAIQAEIQKDNDNNNNNNNNNHNKEDDDKNNSNNNDNTTNNNNTNNINGGINIECDKEVNNNDDDAENEGKDGRKKKKKRKMAEDGEGGVKVSKREETTAGFSWSGCLHELLLQSPSHQLSIKKIKKKFLREFKERCLNEETYTDEEILSKMERKMRKKCAVEGAVVRLKE